MRVAPILISIAALAVVCPDAATTSARAASVLTGELVDFEQLDVKPELKKPVKLKFKKKRVTGEVTLRFIVTAEGEVQDIVIVKFNDPDFVEPSFEAYERASYNPGMKDGVPVNTRVEVALIFEPK